LRGAVAAGGKQLEAILTNVSIMSRYQGIEGITLIDSDDQFNVQSGGALTGAAETIHSLMQQIAGALQVPLTRLLGQSPGGLDSSGESDTNSYYDSILQKQEYHLREGIERIYKLIAASESIQITDSFNITFKHLKQTQDSVRADIAEKIQRVICAYHDNGIIDNRQAIESISEQAEISGFGANIKYVPTIELPLAEG
jgi:phage-related protein (TIGR01555 family)